MSRWFNDSLHVDQDTARARQEDQLAMQAREAAANADDGHARITDILSNLSQVKSPPGSAIALQNAATSLAAESCAPHEAIHE